MTQRAAPVVTPGGGSLIEDRLLLEPEVEAMIPMHRSTRFRKIRADEFPAPIWISKGRRAWRLSVLLAWINAREAHPIRPRPYFGKKEPPTPAPASDRSYRLEGQQGRPVKVAKKKTTTEEKTKAER